MDGDRPEDSGRRVGRVIAVSASRATVLLDAEDLAPLEMGDVVKMRTRAGTVYAMVSRLEVSDPGLEPSDQDLKTAEIEFAGEIGEADGSPPGFQRGISAYPALDEPVWLRNRRRSAAGLRSSRSGDCRGSARFTRPPACPPTF